MQGGASVADRQVSAAECAKREEVFGFAICGMGTGETPRQRGECLAAVTAQLPPERLRMLQGALTPDGMLEAAVRGIDLFDATYATQVMLFPFPTFYPPKQYGEPWGATRRESCLDMTSPPEGHLALHSPVSLRASRIGK